MGEWESNEFIEKTIQENEKRKEYLEIAIIVESDKYEFDSVIFLL